MKVKNAHIHPLHLSLLCLASLACSPWLSAKTIYQYVDQHGAMAFSDSPPESTTDFVEIELPDTPDPSPVEAEQTLEEMVRVTEALEAKRREAEAARRQEQEARASRRAYDRESDRGSDRNRDRDYGFFYPGYPAPGYGDRRPPHNPGYVSTVPDDPAIQRRQELRVPLRLPAFGTGESYRNRIAPHSEHNRR